MIAKGLSHLRINIYNFFFPNFFNSGKGNLSLSQEISKYKFRSLFLLLLSFLSYLYISIKRKINLFRFYI